MRETEGGRRLWLLPESRKTELVEDHPRLFSIGENVIKPSLSGAFDQTGFKKQQPCDENIPIQVKPQNDVQRLPSLHHRSGEHKERRAE